MTFRRAEESYKDKIAYVMPTCVGASRSVHSHCLNASNQILAHWLLAQVITHASRTPPVGLMPCYSASGSGATVHTKCQSGNNIKCSASQSVEARAGFSALKLDQFASSNPCKVRPIAVIVSRCCRMRSDLQISVCAGQRPGRRLQY